MDKNILDKMPKVLITHMLKQGLIFSIGSDEFDRVYLDLNTAMKSHAWMYYENEEYVIRMRYGESMIVKTMGDVASCIQSCTHNREFMNGAWCRIVEFGDFQCHEKTMGI